MWLLQLNYLIREVQKISALNSCILEMYSCPKQLKAFPKPFKSNRYGVAWHKHATTQTIFTLIGRKLSEWSSWTPCVTFCTSELSSRSKQCIDPNTNAVLTPSNCNVTELPSETRNCTKEGFPCPGTRSRLQNRSLSFRSIKNLGTNFMDCRGIYTGNNLEDCLSVNLYLALISGGLSNFRTSVRNILRAPALA